MNTTKNQNLANQSFLTPGLFIKSRSVGQNQSLLTAGAGAMTTVGKFGPPVANRAYGIEQVFEWGRVVSNGGGVASDLFCSLSPLLLARL